MATGLHEEYTRDCHVEAASNKRFGLIVGGIALAFGCIRAYLHGEIGIVAGLMGGVGLVLIAAALVQPDVLEGANRGWGELRLLLHKGTHAIFLRLMYVRALGP